MKIFVVLTYFQRQFQLNKTLQSIAKTKHDNFEVIIVDDNSTDDIMLPLVLYPITVIKTKDKTWTDRDIPANIGFAEALKRGADIIISQNAECYHVGDVLEYAEKVTDDSYISFGCYSLNEEETFKDHDIREVIRLNDVCAVDDGQNAWYNHPVHRPVCYDFCAAMTRNTLLKLNGFDERFSFGIGYGDDYLIHRIKTMGLTVDIPTYPFVVHQWHYSHAARSDSNELIQKNYQLYNNLIKENNFKAVHLLTPNLG